MYPFRHFQRPHGLTDKASDFEPEDWGFESLVVDFSFFEKVNSDNAQQIKR